MNPADPEYAAFLDRLPEIRRLYDPRLHQFEVTRGRGHGDSLANVERYFERVGSVREPNRQTLRRLVTFVDHVRGGASREDAVEQAWRDCPDPRHGIPRCFGAPPAVRQQHARLQDEQRTPQCVRGANTEGRLPSLDDCVECIEAAYSRIGHSLGWRFLHCATGGPHARAVTLARLPHLSTFKLFSRRACRHPMDTFLRYVFGPVALNQSDRRNQ